MGEHVLLCSLNLGVAIYYGSLIICRCQGNETKDFKAVQSDFYLLD